GRSIEGGPVGLARDLEGQRVVIGIAGGGLEAVRGAHLGGGRRRTADGRRLIRWRSGFGRGRGGIARRRGARGLRRGISGSVLAVGAARRQGQRGQSHQQTADNSVSVFHYFFEIHNRLRLVSRACASFSDTSKPHFHNPAWLQALPIGKT